MRQSSKMIIIVEFEIKYTWKIRKGSWLFRRSGENISCQKKMYNRKIQI